MSRRSTAMLSAPVPESIVSPEIVDDRYLIERVLGRGGVGEVLAVVEPATGLRFALKRLLPGAKRSQALFLQREFHTLAGLKHPNVVQAFEFGNTDGLPYYTMELLAGSDVDASAPMPWTEVVPILRDVASALSVMHARRLVHRDVGARNVWRTPEGTVKLIDFGALTNFGTSADLAGTPPYVAPEALRTHVLDQRTDLYALGALAYLLLTGRHAYPSRTLAELEQHWARGFIPLGTRISDLARADLPPIPEPLEQLIEALLAANPDARPSTAAEVLDLTNELLPGSAAVSQVALDGILASKAFVGRLTERKDLRSLLASTLTGTGASAALLGPRGIGRSRLLAELAVEVRVAGALVIQLSGDEGSGVLSAATRAALKLLEIAPRIAGAAAAPYAGVLGHLSDELCQLLGIAANELERFPELPGEARMRLQSALKSFFLQVSAGKPLVLLIDDLQAMDEASAALFATLARDAGRTSLFVVAAVRDEPEQSAPPTVQAFVAAATALRLGSLSPQECEEMLRSIFGDVEHLARTSQKLADIAEGNTGRLIELCEHLVQNRKIRCIEGVWVLPQELSDLDVPSSSADLNKARLARLSKDAIDLACALSIFDGAAAIELCSALSPLPPQRMFAALDELCSVGVLTKADNGFVLRDGSLRATLAERLDESAKQQTHTAAGEALLALDQPSRAQRVRAGHHLMKGGSARRGVEVVHDAVIEIVRSVPDDIAEIARLLEEVHVLARSLDLHDAEKLSLLSSLSMCSFFVDRRLGFVYGDEALACGERVCGMNLARRLSPWLGKTLGLLVALIIAGARLRRRAKKSKLAPDLETAILLFMTAAGSLAGMYTLCLARDKVLDSARAIEPLSGLGPNHAASIVHRFAVGCTGSISDRQGKANEHWAGLLARLNDPRPIKGLAGTKLDYYFAASMYAGGSAKCWQDNLEALEIAERLEKQPLKLYQLSADQVRAQYYSQQGKMREVAACRARIETSALQRGMTWQLELWWPASAVAMATRQRDVMTLKHAIEQLRLLSADTPSLVDHFDYARASYFLLRGRSTEALALLEPLVGRRCYDDIGYANLAGLLAHAYSQLHRYADAERVALQAIRQLDPDDLDYPALTLRVQIELCLAQGALGQTAKAAADLDALIARHTPNQGPLTLGALHAARAQVALRALDETTSQHHFEQMERWYRSTDCPALIQYCDRIERRRTRVRELAGEGPRLPTATLLDHVSTHLTGGRSQEQSTELLSQLVRSTMAKEGILAYTHAEGPCSVLKSRTDKLPEALTAWLEERISAMQTLATETQSSDTPEVVDPNVICCNENNWHMFPLVADELVDPVVGAIVLCEPMHHVPLEVLQVMAQRHRDEELLLAGNVQA